VTFSTKAYMYCGISSGTYFRNIKVLFEHRSISLFSVTHVIF
jgi:hypothetical protein